MAPRDREIADPSSAELPAEKLFDREWALALLERVMKQLEKECAVARKAELFERLKETLTAEGEDGLYRQIAADLNMSEGAVRVSAHRLRRRFGDLLREQIGKTVADPAEIDAEIRELFAVL
jgi:RNA polymerase sigma-70 factor (ECF subfamily)